MRLRRYFVPVLDGMPEPNRPFGSVWSGRGRPSAFRSATRAWSAWAVRSTIPTPPTDGPSGHDHHCAGGKQSVNLALLTRLPPQLARGARSARQAVLLAQTAAGDARIA